MTASPLITNDLLLLAQSRRTGMSAFARYWGDKRTSILPHLTASVCSAFPFTPASLIRLAGATFMIFGVVLIRT